MYINRKQQQQDHAVHEDTPSDTEIPKPKKKKIPKKKNLFGSSDEEGEGEEKLEPAKIEKQPETNLERRGSGYGAQGAAIFDEPEQEEDQIEQDEEDENEQQKQEYKEKMKEIAHQEIQKKEKQMENQPTSFTELFEEAGNDREKMKRLIYEPIPKGYKLTSLFKRVSSGFS